MLLFLENLSSVDLYVMAFLARQFISWSSSSRLRGVCVCVCSNKLGGIFVVFCTDCTFFHLSFSIWHFHTSRFRKSFFFFFFLFRLQTATSQQRSRRVQKNSNKLMRKSWARTCFVRSEKWSWFFDDINVCCGSPITNDVNAMCIYVNINNAFTAMCTMLPYVYFRAYTLNACYPGML